MPRLRPQAAPRFPDSRRAGCRPRGRGPVWPRCTSNRAGLHPWFISEPEAEELAATLRGVARFARMLRVTPGFHDRWDGSNLPLLANGTGEPRPADIEWVPLELPSPRVIEPLALTPARREELARLPRREDLTLECGKSGAIANRMRSKNAPKTARSNGFNAR